MGSVITFLLAFLLIGYSGYIFFGQIRREIKGSGGSACGGSGCAGCAMRSKHCSPTDF